MGHYDCTAREAARENYEAAKEEYETAIENFQEQRRQKEGKLRPCVTPELYQAYMEA